MKVYCLDENVSCLLFVAFWLKEVMFFSSFRQFKPIAVPRSVVLSTGSNALRPYIDRAAACSATFQWCDLHFRLDPYRDAGLPMQWQSPTQLLQLPRSWLCTQRLARSGFEGNLIRQRHSRRCGSKTFSCRQSIEPSRGECQALPGETSATPKSFFFTRLHISHSRKEENRQQQRKTARIDRRQQQLFAASRMRTTFAPCGQTYKNVRGGGG